MNMKTFIIEATDTVLHGRQYGDVGSPVVLIHGACVDADFWNDCAAYLSKYHRVFTYDRRGYGRNEETDDHSIQIQAEDACRLIRLIGEPCFVVGHSAGSLIAMELALTHPELVRGIFLYEPVKNDLLDTEHSTVIDAYKQTMDVVTAKACSGKYTKAVTLFLPLMGEKDSRARAASDDELKHMFKNCFCFVKHELTALHDYHPDYIRLSSLGMPVTLGLGENSRGSARDRMAQILVEKLHADLLYFPGGHNCPYDLPREFTYLLEGNITY